MHGPLISILEGESEFLMIQLSHGYLLTSVTVSIGQSWRWISKIKNGPDLKLTALPLSHRVDKLLEMLISVFLSSY